MALAKLLPFAVGIDPWPGLRAAPFWTGLFCVLARQDNAPSCDTTSMHGVRIRPTQRACVAAGFTLANCVQNG
jgi:hypothetical protein